MNDQILKYCNEEIYDNKLNNASEFLKNNRLQVDEDKLLRL
jgi:hypothetical protein